MISMMLKYFRFQLPGSYGLYILSRKIVQAYEARGETSINHSGEEWFIEAMKLLSPKVFFDVGANRGDWALTVAKHHLDALIYCYEPVPNTFAALSARSLERMLCFDFGLSDSFGNKAIYQRSGNSFTSSLHLNSDEIQASSGSGTISDLESFEVEFSTGDQEMARLKVKKISMLKIDCEGHDGAILDGFSAAIAAGAIDVIQFEHNQYTLWAKSSFAEKFAKLSQNYLICRLRPDALEAVGYAWSFLENIDQANFIALRLDLVTPEIVRHFNIRSARGLLRYNLRKQLSNKQELFNLLTR